jgi:hypothetical protein
MHLFRETLLLFALNFIDAVLTLLWVRTGTATEANYLMAGLLEIGDFPFLLVKLAMGSITCFVLLKWGYKSIAKPLVTVALILYIGLMGVHVFTGLAAYGYLSQNTIREVTLFTQAVIATAL